MDSNSNNRIGDVNPIVVLAPLIVTAGVGWQLITGTIIARSHYSSITRTKTPGMYWSCIGIEIALALSLCVAVFQTFRRRP